MFLVRLLARLGFTEAAVQLAKKLRTRSVYNMLQPHWSPKRHARIVAFLRHYTMCPVCGRHVPKNQVIHDGCDGLL